MANRVPLPTECTGYRLSAVVSHVAVTRLIIRCRLNYNEYNEPNHTNMVFQILHNTFILKFDYSALYRNLKRTG